MLSIRSIIIINTAMSYERLNCATVETMKKYSVNVECMQLSKKVQSLLRLLSNGCSMFCIHRTLVNIFKSSVCMAL